MVTEANKSRVKETEFPAVSPESVLKKLQEIDYSPLFPFAQPFGIAEIHIQNGKASFVALKQTIPLKA